jgi:hypothetical protein
VIFIAKPLDNVTTGMYTKRVNRMVDEKKIKQRENELK